MSLHQGMILFNVLGIGANLLKQIESFESILIGRLIFGIICGIQTQYLVKTVNETIPFEHMQKYGIAMNAGINIGIVLINTLQAGIIPLKDNGKEALKQDNNWRIVFAIPIALEIIVIFSLLVFIRRPSLKNTILNCSN